MTEFYLPQLKGRVEQLEDLPGNQAYIENLYTVGHIAADWESLRRRVLREPDPNQPDASNVTVDGIQHLQSIAEVLERRIEDLKEEQVKEYQHLRHWASESEGPPEDSADSERRKRVIQASERRLEEIEEKLSFSRYRRSMVETMLTQIATFDYIQKWSAFWGGPGSSAEGGGESAADGRVNPDTLSLSQKRTILIGKALKYYREEYDRLVPLSEDDERLSENNEFYRWATALEHELLKVSVSSIENDLKNTDCWIKGTSGDPGPHLREIMLNCINYADAHTWELSEEKEERLEKSALESN
jgi:hypothetical protein